MARFLRQALPTQRMTTPANTQPSRFRAVLYRRMTKPCNADAELYHTIVSQDRAEPYIAAAAHRSAQQSVAPRNRAMAMPNGTLLRSHDAGQCRTLPAPRVTLLYCALAILPATMPIRRETDPTIQGHCGAAARCDTKPLHCSTLLLRHITSPLLHQPLLSHCKASQDSCLYGVVLCLPVPFYTPP